MDWGLQHQFVSPVHALEETGTRCHKGTNERLGAEISQVTSRNAELVKRLQDAPKPQQLELLGGGRASFFLQSQRLPQSMVLHRIAPAPGSDCRAALSRFMQRAVALEGAPMASLPEVTDPTAPPRTWRIPLQLLDPNPHQPRRAVDEDTLEGLVSSIREHGLLQPISVRRISGGRYQLIAGHRRLEAYRRLFAAALDTDARERFETIPAHEKYDVTDEEMALFALVENLQRDDLSPVDAALGLVRFQVANELSNEALAQRTGLEPDRVKRLLRLARAPRVVQDACHEGVLVEQVDQQGAAKLLPRATRNRAHPPELMAALELRQAARHRRQVGAQGRRANSEGHPSSAAELGPWRRIRTFRRAAISGGKQRKTLSKQRGFHSTSRALHQRAGGAQHPPVVRLRRHRLLAWRSERRSSRC